MIEDATLGTRGSQISLVYRPAPAPAKALYAEALLNFLYKAAVARQHFRGPMLCWRLLRFGLSLCVLLLGLSLGDRPAIAATDNFFFTPGPSVSLLTFGPGDEPFARFGHNALRVTDREAGTDIVYNFGTFHGGGPALILQFLSGRLHYWLSTSNATTTINAYRRANRSVTEQVLNLGDIAARELADRLKDNALPANRTYLYDYYRDNCSTRIRDALDSTLHGALQQRFQDMTPLSLRDHTLRSVSDSFWLYFGLDIAMGSYIDRQETRWSEMFLPERLMQSMDTVVFDGAHGRVSLVKERREIYKAIGRELVRRVPPRRTWQFFQVGVAGGFLFVFLGWEAYRRRQRWAEVALCVCIALLGLWAGSFGSLFVGLWAFTNHEVAYRNENILQCAPWTLALFWLAWGMFRGRPKAIHLIHQLLWGALAASALGLVAKWLPFMPQRNERIIALFLPLWAGAFTAVHLMRLRHVHPLLLAEPVGLDQPELEAVSEDEEEEPRPSRRPPRSIPPKSEKEVPETRPEGEPSPA